MSIIHESFGRLIGRFDADKMASVNIIIQFDFGEDNQHHLIIANGTIKHEEGEADEPRAIVSMSAEDFDALTDQRLNGMQAFMQGKIKVQGDMGALLKLNSLGLG